ncbi:MAG: RpiB/LacA/LacB family sugar-phosphate isomerase [Chloroflexi bacterium]|nr:RpiB/LacA/LacB family sugar-phosphate isomerase [Chloroflexota bacterium]
MRVAVGADHAGLSLREVVISTIEAAGHEAIYLGAHEYDAEDDYPDCTAPVAVAVQSGDADRGVMLCGSGIGAAMTANKFRGVRASVCHDTYSAAQGVVHDDMNVLCIGGRVVGDAIAPELVNAFLSANMGSEERYHRRLNKLNDIEAANFGSG